MPRLLLLEFVFICLLLAPGFARADVEDCTGDLTPSNPANPVLALDTSLGSICIELLEDQAPITAANFLAYHDGESLFHRGIAGFIVQGGGFQLDESGTALEDVPSLGEIQNEPCSLDEPSGVSGVLRCSIQGNVRGSLAMAKRGDPLCPSQPPNPNCVSRPDYITTFLPGEEFVNSATNEWFINLSDNRTNLDNQNGGFTVFAMILGDGLDIADQVGALNTLRSPYSSLLTLPASLVSVFSDLPVRALPEYPVSGVGCFDRSTAGALADSGGKLLVDPILAQRSGASSTENPYLVGAACGTPITSSDYVPNPSESPLCNGIDLPAALIDQLPDGSIALLLPNVLFQITCAEVEQSVADSRAAMMPVVIDQIVFVPEPTAALAYAACVLSLAWLANRRRPR